MINDSDLKGERLPELRGRVDHMLDQLHEEFYRTVPGGSHLATADKIDREYYRRHIIEIILRLRMKRWIDALTIHYFAKHEPFLAKKWAQYTEDEMLHDRMFVKDLERIGTTLEDVYREKPMFSTKILQGYFYYGLEHEGRPLASLCSSYFIEKMSQVVQPGWLENVEKRMGKGAAHGQLAHINHDKEDDHVSFVWNVIATFVKSEADKEEIIVHIHNVYKLFCAFYTELYQTTIAKTDTVAPVVAQLGAG
ncbi:MAG TPA: hypothetical protein VFS57_10860 [Gemmatimonadaceae bacterium]|nr:hypothetical protein [Gemmatimonadaceae bacterium]